MIFATIQPHFFHFLSTKNLQPYSLRFERAANWFSKTVFLAVLDFKSKLLLIVKFCQVIYSTVLIVTIPIHGYLIISAKEIMFYKAVLCLTICLLGALQKSHWLDLLHESLTTYLSVGKDEVIKFLESSISRFRIFLKDSTTLHFSKVWIVSKTDWMFMKILSLMYLWTRKSQLVFGSHPDPESVPGQNLPWQRSALLECSCYPFLLDCI